MHISRFEYIYCFIFKYNVKSTMYAMDIKRQKKQHLLNVEIPHADHAFNSGLFAIEHTKLRLKL